MRKNWRTTLLGLLAGLPDLVLGILEKDPVKITKAVCVIGLGALAKDHAQN